MNILISGGAGSLGKAFAKYLQNSHRVHIVDNNEWAMAEARKELNCKFQLADVSAIKHLKGFDVLIHCAAYKHVELGEENPVDFIDNNINKTRRLFSVAYHDQCKIMFISTDKAVEPISLYGYTKAVGEYITRYFEGTIVRLGNLISSSGSVFPIWEKAIAEKKPLPITSLDMIRYCGIDSEVVPVIWEKFMFGEKLIISDWMKTYTMRHLINTVLAKHGLPNDYPLEIIGIRPGEKLVEKMRWDYE